MKHYAGLFSIFLLTAGVANADFPLPKLSGDPIGFAGNVASWIKEIPGRVLHATEVVKEDLASLKEKYDAIVFENDESLLNAAKEANLYVTSTQIGDKNYYLVVLDTAQHDDIVDWLTE